MKLKHLIIACALVSGVISIYFWATAPPRCLPPEYKHQWSEWAVSTNFVRMNFMGVHDVQERHCRRCGWKETN